MFVGKVEVLVTSLLAASACAHAPGPATSTPSASVAFYKGSTVVHLPGGRDVPGGTSYVKRTVDPTHQTITEEVVQAASRPGDQPREFVVTMQVDGSHFVMNDASNAFTGDGDLVGEPWHWNHWVSRSRLPDGSSVVSEDTLEGKGLKAEKTIKDAQGAERVKLSESFEPIDEAAFEAARKQLLGQSAAPPRAEAGHCPAPTEGELVHASDGGAFWYKVAGNVAGPVTVYVHGGPGYNSYAFEKAVGTQLETRLRMVYLDQRGCGRALAGGDQGPYGLAATVEDLELLRERLGVEKLNLIAHSFGGVVATAYVKAHPNCVSRLILVDTTANLFAALTHQVATLASLGPTRFPTSAAQLQAIASSEAPVSAKLEQAYALLSPGAVQTQLHYATSEGQARNERWDVESGLRECNSSKSFGAYAKEGVLDSTNEALLAPLPVPAVLFAGRKSEVVGASNIEAAAKSWGIPVHWFERSGHFIYAEEPKEFATAAIEFLTAASL